MKIKTALVHDWLVTWRGGEKVLLELARMFPEAPIFTLFLDKGCLPDELKSRVIICNPFFNRLRFARKALLPLLPWLIERIDLSGFDLVVSTSSCVAKGAIKARGAKHLCYIHSPMRYAWDQKREYLGRLLDLPAVGWVLEFVLKKLRNWDVRTAPRVDLYVANSSFVKNRVKTFYGLESKVVYPPIDLDGFPVRGIKKDYFLAAGALVSYKRFDLAITAAETIGFRLIVAGSGPEEARLRAMAGNHTEFMIGPEQNTWVELLQGAKALLFPGVEDFGMIAIEAMACGTPVIAARAGGALDFVIEGKTGLFFEVGDSHSLIRTIRKLSDTPFSPDELSAYARGFSREGFKANMRQHLKDLTGADIL